MKRIYEAPEISLREIDAADVITTSGAMALPIVPLDDEGVDW